MTKYGCPSPAISSVPRQRIGQQLSAEGWRFALVAGGAASGKTTAVAQWIDRLHDRQALWVTLDDRDDRAERFWLTLAGGLDWTFPGAFARSISAATRATRSGASAVEALLSDLAALPTALVIVLDDVHTIRSEDIFTDLAYLIEHLPAPIQIIVSSRTDPALPLSRWRLRDWNSSRR